MWDPVQSANLGAWKVKCENLETQLAEQDRVLAENDRMRTAIRDLCLLCRKEMDAKERGQHAARIAGKVGVVLSPLREVGGPR